MKEREREKERAKRKGELRSELDSHGQTGRPLSRHQALVKGVRRYF